MMRQASWSDEAKSIPSLLPDFWLEYGSSVPVRLKSESIKCCELDADRTDLGGRKPRGEGLAKKVLLSTGLFSASNRTV